MHYCPDTSKYRNSIAIHKMKKCPIHIIKRLSKLELLPLQGKKKVVFRGKSKRKKLAQIISILYKKKKGAGYK